ncbi:UNVERIFIED_CONTAM: hypothetical protein NCL1_40488 [Trichonephila clavipes]
MCYTFKKILQEVNYDESFRHSALVEKAEVVIQNLCAFLALAVRFFTYMNIGDMENSDRTLIFLLNIKQQIYAFIFCYRAIKKKENEVKEKKSKVEAYEGISLSYTSALEDIGRKQKELLELEEEMQKLLEK